MNATRTAELATKYAEQAKAATNERYDDAVRKGFSGSEPSRLGAARKAFLDAYEAATYSMNWCDMRRISYTDAAEAVRIQRERNVIRLK